MTPGTTDTSRGLPELLRFATGAAVSTAEQWRSRRLELLELFRAHVYGRAPVGRPAALGFEVEPVAPAAVAGAARVDARIRYEGPGGSGGIGVRLYLPTAAAPKGGFPLLLLGSNRDASATFPPAPGEPRASVAEGFWPVEEIVAHVYATAAFLFSDVDPDVHDGFRDGVHGVFDDAKRARDAWGTIAAWAWGFSRVMDLLETIPALDAGRVGLVGHSRGGKTALWAAAQDERFRLVMANGSGSTGAALARGKSGERIADIVERFPHWFCANYAEYAEREGRLPVDQHMLLALVAPRAVYLGSAEEDDWADPRSERAALAAAAPAWGLLGSGGQLGYHLRPGGHDLTLTDWRHLLDFARSRL